ncbi:MAG: FAD-binding monooxygenase [bacterium]|nr:FAD-binding monooxygenase [bacterium]
MSPSDVAVEQSREHLGRHALVIGGSVAGILAARVLADSFSAVTVVERDRLPSEAANRKGVPQGRHVHTLLRRGSDALEELFPGLIGELIDDTAVQVDLLNGLPLYIGGWQAACPGRQLPGLFLSRALLEWRLDEHIRSCARVQLLEKTEVTGLLLTSQGKRVRGASIRDLESGTREELDADLVVETSGRGSRLPRWLEDLGFPAPPRSEVRLPTRYVTRTFKTAECHRHWDGMLIFPRPPGRRGGALFPIERGEWMVTLIGLLGDDPPESGDGAFVEFAKTLPTPELYDAIAAAEPTSPIVAHDFPSNLRRHYERCSTIPGGLAVMGDAVCSLNPRFGQGITVAALEALELRAALGQMQADDLPRLGAEFARRVAKVIDLAWPGVVAADLQYPEAKGDRSVSVRFMQWYQGRMVRSGLNDPRVRERFLRGMNFLDPPSSLLRPSFAARVLRGSMPGGPSPTGDATSAGRQ